jgi:small nuclear ribonucleoprotein (snRNP)-like protein
MKPYTSPLAWNTASRTHKPLPLPFLSSTFLIQGEADMLTAPSSFFKTLIDHEVTVELKNDIQIRGVLKSVDQYLNIKLDNIQVLEEIKYPHMVSPPFLPFLMYWSG